MAIYRSPLKFLHFKSHLAGLEQGQIVAPVHVRINPATTAITIAGTAPTAPTTLTSVMKCSLKTASQPTA